MKQFVLVANSTTDETAAYYEKNDIQCAPLTFEIDGHVIRDDFGRTMPYRTFYNKLRQENLSKTSPAKHADYVQIFETACSQGQDVLYIGFSSALSESYQNAERVASQLKKKYPEREIVCVDSCNASGGEAILLQKAVAMRDAGCSIAQTVNELLSLRHQIMCIVAVDNLHHLYRGGRISLSKALMGTLIGMKPLIYIDNNGLLQSYKTIWGRKNVLEYMISYVVRHMRDNTVGVRIGHADCLYEAQYIAQALQKYGITSRIRMINTVIGSHTGADALTVCFVADTRKPTE